MRACVRARVCVCVFKSKVSKKRLSEGTFSIYDVMIFVTSCFDSWPIWITRGPIWVHARAGMGHARADMGSREWADMDFA